LGQIGQLRRDSIRHAYNDANKTFAYLQKDKNLRACQLLLGHTKLESTVRYLVRVQLVDDALEVSEGIDS
jgi:site-specific recombinase XerC